LPSGADELQVLAFLVDVVGYRDRMLMLRAASAELGGIRLLTSSLPPGWDPREVETPRFQVIPVSPRPVRRARLQLLLARRVRQLLATTDARILHDSHGFFLPTFVAERLRRPRRRVLLTSIFAALYDWEQVVRHRWPYDWGKFLVARWRALGLERLQAATADACTLFGEGHLNPFAAFHGLDRERVFSLPNCVDPARFAPQPPDPAITGFPPGSQVLLYTGALFRHKGIFDLVIAFSRVAAAFPQARLLLVGQAHPPELRRLVDLVAGLGLGERVRIREGLPREELPRLLSSCQVFVFPSYNEGSPRSVIEALACGLPVVGSRIPGITTLDPGERFIDLVERGDVPGLTAALTRQLADPAAARRRGELGRAHFLAAHTPAAAGRALAALYRRLDRQLAHPAPPDPR
jgi:glycosyltransferase involved in cell wall biosynthesis